MPLRLQIQPVRSHLSEEVDFGAASLSAGGPPLNHSDQGSGHRRGCDHDFDVHPQSDYALGFEFDRALRLIVLAAELSIQLRQATPETSVLASTTRRFNRRLGVRAGLRRQARLPRLRGACCAPRRVSRPGGHLRHQLKQLAGAHLRATLMQLAVEFDSLGWRCGHAGMVAPGRAASTPRRRATSPPRK